MVPKILTEIFPQKENNYSLRKSTTLQSKSIKTLMYGSKTKPIDQKCGAFYQRN